jgi:hypothetical protein
MAKKTVDMVVEKYRRNLAAAGPDYRYGVANPTRPWLEGFIASSDRMKAELQKALTEGRHIKGAREKGQKRYDEKVATVGADRFTAAAELAARHYSEIAGDVMSAADAARRSAQALPNVTFEDRLNRMRAAVTAIHDYWSKKGK